MIRVDNNRFFLTTKKTSYIFEVTSHGHLNQLYYGPKIFETDIGAVRLKHDISLGGNIQIDNTDSTYVLDSLLLEFSSTGKGDYREPSIELIDNITNFNSNFIFNSYELIDEKPKIQKGIVSKDHLSAKSLAIKLIDKSISQRIILHYTCYEDFDIITRRLTIENCSENDIVITKLMSCTLDLLNRDYTIYNLSGTWARESHLKKRKVSSGSFVNQSTTGATSHFFNSGVMLSSLDKENEGISIGLNMIYSGNHYCSIHHHYLNTIRVNIGINPLNFNLDLAPNEIFETPEVVITLSNQGNNGVSKNFHDFINHCIVRQPNLLKPVVYNNWEATMFDFNEAKLLNLAKKAKEIGVELFVVDDGWFSDRNSDHSGLGDYHVNKRKFPKGLHHFFKKIKEMDLKCGIWVEPEMVNMDSDLYRNHPEWVIKTPYTQSAMGRNQLVLDLSNPLVQKYIIDNVSKLIDDNAIDYIKWDMNRHISDAYGSTLKNQGTFYHEYILGLYRVLDSIFTPRPSVLLEMCSSGGNRFDLGMLCFATQIWSSDNTDPIERLKIQEGLSYFYPVSVISNHVSVSPHASTLRQTPLSTRFNVSAFGAFGYELDLNNVTSVELKEMKDQTEFYKKYRKILQYGTFYRFNLEKDNCVQWQLTLDDTSIVGYFQKQTNAVESFEYLKTIGLKDSVIYHFYTKPQRLMIDRFKEHLHHVVPIHLRPSGFVLTQAEKYIALKDGTVSFNVSGNALNNGIVLNNQFMASGYNKALRILSDFGSQLYVIEREYNE